MIKTAEAKKISEEKKSASAFSYGEKISELKIMEIKKSEAVAINSSSNFIDVLHVASCSQKNRADKISDAFGYALFMQKKNMAEVGFSFLASEVQSVLNSRLNDNEDSYYEISSKDGRISLFINEKNEAVFSASVSVCRGGFCVEAVSNKTAYRNGLKGSEGFKTVAKALHEVLSSVNFDYQKVYDAVNVLTYVKVAELSSELRDFYNSFASESSTTYYACELMLRDKFNEINDAQKEASYENMASEIIREFQRKHKEGKLGGKTKDIKNKIVFMLRDKFEAEAKKRAEAEAKKQKK